MGGVGDLSVVLGREVVLLGPPQAQPCQVVSLADSGGGARLSPGRITIGSATAEEKGPQEGSNLVE